MKTDLGSRIVRAWAIVPAAVNERETAADLLETGPAPRDLLADKGFSGRAFAAAQAARGTAVLVPPGKKQRAGTPPAAESHREWRKMRPHANARRLPSPGGHGVAPMGTVMAAASAASVSTSASGRSRSSRMTSAPATTR